MRSARTRSRDTAGGPGAVGDGDAGRREGPRRPGRTVSAVPDLVFVYGTLMRGFPLHHLIDGRCEFVGDGTARGRLLDLGEYPGAVPDERGTVHGEVYRFSSLALLSALDRAEDYDPTADARSLYLRRPTTVRLGDGRELTAWMYWYQGFHARAVPIPGGDYRQHLPARARRH